MAPSARSTAAVSTAMTLALDPLPPRLGALVAARALGLGYHLLAPLDPRSNRRNMAPQPPIALDRGVRPPRISTIRSRSSVLLLDGLDLPCGEPPPFPLGEPPQAHWPVGHAVQPLHSESQRFGEPAHDAVPAFGQRQLQLHAPLRRTRADGRHAHRPAVDRRRPR